MFENYDPAKVTNSLLEADRNIAQAYKDAITPQEQQNIGFGLQDSTYHLDAQTHSEHLYNLKNKDPNAYRKQRLEVASERAKNILDGDAMKEEQERNHLLAQGFTPEEVDAQFNEENKFNALSSQERLHNLVALRRGDPDALYDRKLVEDFSKGDLSVLEAKYGKDIADYAYQENAERFKALGLYTAQQNTDGDFLSWETVGNMGNAIARKAVDTMDSMGNAVDLMVNGEDAVERISNRQGTLAKLSDSIKDEMSYSYKLGEKSGQAEDALRDRNEFQRAQEYLGKGDVESKAERKANADRQIDQALDVFDSTQKFTSQASEIAADLFMGGAVGKSAYLAGKTATNAIGKLAEKQIKKNIDKAVAKKVASKYEPELQAKYSGEKLQSQLAQAKLSMGKKADEIGVSGKLQFQSKNGVIKNNNGVHEQIVTATGSNTGNKIFKGTIAEQSVANTGKQLSTQVGNAIEKSRDNVIKYQTSQIAQKLKNKVEPKVMNKFRKDISELAHKAGNITAIAGITAHGANQEAMEAIGSTYEQMMSIEPDRLYKTPKGQEIIDSLVQEKGFNSFEEAKSDKGFQQSLYEKQSELAKSTAISAYKEVFKDSATVNLLTSRAEMAVGGLTKKAKSFKKVLADTSLRLIGEPIEEYVEGYSGEYNPKNEINKAVGSQVYNPTKQAAAIGLQGAITALAGTGVITGLTHGKKPVVAGATKGINKINTVGTISSNVQDDNDLKSIVTGVDISSTKNTPKNLKEKIKNSVGVSSALDKDVQENLNKEFEKTELFKVSSKLDNEISNLTDEKLKEKFSKDTSLTSRIGFLNDTLQHTNNEINKLETKNNLTQEEQERLNTLTNSKNSLLSTMTAFQNAFNEDLNKLDEIKSKHSKKLMELYEHYDNLVANEQITPEKRNEILSQAMADAQATEESINNRIANLEQSALYNAIFKTDLEEVIDNIDTTQFISKEELNNLTRNYSSSINLSQKFNESIDKIEKDKSLSSSQKRNLKQKLAKEMVKSVMDINTRSIVSEDNVRDHWKNLGETVNGVIQSLSNKDYGLEPNSSHLIIGMLSHIKDISDRITDPNSRISNKEAITLIGKYVGTANGGHKNKGNIGLLAYAQRALENKGKFLPTDNLKLKHFFATQETKLLRLEALELEMLNSGKLEDGKVTSGSFKLKNPSLKRGDTALTQNQEKEIEFTSLGELRSYKNMVKKDQKEFAEFAEKFLKIDLKPYAKVSGAKATKEIVNPTNIQEESVSDTNTNKITNETTNETTKKPIKSEKDVNTKPESSTDRAPKEVIKEEKAKKTKEVNVPLVQEEIKEPETKKESEKVQEQKKEESSTHITEPVVNENSYSVSALKSLDKWKNTANWVKSEYHALHNDTYRLMGVNLFKNPETGEIELSNILHHKDIHINEPKNLLPNHLITSTETQEQLLEEVGKYYSSLNLPENVEMKSEGEYIKYYINLVKEINKYLQSVTLVEKNVTTPTSNKFNLNGIVQLLDINKVDGKPQFNYPIELPQAIAKSLIQIMDTDRISKGSDVRKEYSNDGKYILAIESLNTSKEDEYKPSKTFTESAKDYMAGNFIDPTDTQLATLGTEKNKFVRQLGQSIISNLGIRLKNDSEIQLDYDALVMSMGTQALQMLMSSKIINPVRLAKIPSNTPINEETAGSIVFIDHISFRWNSVFIGGHTQETIKNYLQTKAQIRKLGYRTTSTDEANNIIKKLEPTSSERALKTFQNNHGFSAIGKAMLRLNALSKTHTAKVLFPESENQNKGVSLTPFKAKASDTSNKTTTGNGQIAKNVVQAHNNVPYRFNSDKDKNGLADYLLNKDTNHNQEAFLSFLGDTNSKDNIDEVNKSNASIENGYRRELQIAEEFYYSLDDINKDLFLKHKMISTRRTMIDSQLNPQALKIIRELLLPVSKDKDGNVIQYGFDISNTNDYMEIINEAEELLKDKNYLSKVGEVDVTKDRYVNITGYVLALAQGLGIKVENLYEENAIHQLKELLQKPEIQAMINNIQFSFNKGGKLDKKVLSKAEDFGINTPRGFNSLFTLAQINSKKGINSIGLFEPRLVIEADGKGNGVYNNVKQFNTNFTESYFNNLKRTGNVTLDIILQETLKGKSLEQIEGTKLLADKSNKEDILRDVYEAVADKLVDKIKNGLNLLIKEGKLSKDKSLNEQLFAKYSMREFIKKRSENKELSPQVIEAYKLIYTAKVISELDGIKNLDFNVPLKDLSTYEIARSIAKIAVTPSNYGGQIDGITSQLFNDIKKTLKNRSNELYKIIQTGDDKNINESQLNYKILLNVLGIQSYKDIQVHPTVVPLTKEELDNFASYPNKTESYKLMSNTIGQIMYEAINDVYGEQFSIVRAIVNYDNALFNVFFTEYQDAIKNVIKARNIKNKWVKPDGTILNPKAYNFLTEPELKDILSNLKNIPNVATAMSSNSRLITELLHSGNSISQEVTLELTNGKSNIYSIFNDKLRTQMWSTLKQEWDTFKPAGASLLTSSIVSTESLTQGRLLEEMSKEGIHTLDVYDGIEVNPIYRFKVGTVANKITDEIHNETSLIASFYDYASRTNLDEIMQNIYNNPAIRIAYENNKNSPKNKIQISAQMIVGIQAVLSSINFESSFKSLEEFEDYEKEIKKYESDNRQSLLEYLQKLSKEQDSNEIVTLSVDEKDKAMLMKGLNYMYQGTNKIQSAMDLYRNKALDALATKEIENKYIGSIVNQFGGINNGYVKVGKEAKATLKRFEQFLNKNNYYYGDISDLSLKSSSEALNTFISQDSIIQKALETARKKYSKQYPKVITQDKNKEQVPLDEVTTVDNLIDTLEQKFKDINEEAELTDNHIFQNQLGLSVIPLVKDLVNTTKKIHEIKDIPVTTNKHILAQKLSEQGKELLLRPEVNGFFAGTDGIYLEANKGDVNIFTGLHEILHMGMDWLWHQKYTNTAQFTQEEPNKVAALNLIEEIAKQFSSRFINNSDFLKVTKYLNEQTEFNENNVFKYTTDTAIALSANIQYVFSDEFAKQNPPKIVQQAKANTMKEFITYGLTNAQLMNNLQKVGLKNVEEVYKTTGFKNAWNNLKKLFDDLFNIFLSVFGYEYNKSDRTQNSLLSHSVKALIVLSQNTETKNIQKGDKRRYKKYKNNSASINTTSFNNSNFNQTEDAINSLGSLQGNSKAHIENMKSIYESINNTLEVKDYRSYTEAYKDLKNNTYNQEAIKDLTDLSTAGLRFTALDENMFKVMRAVNKVNFENNPSYAKESIRLLNSILKQLPASFRGGVFQPILAKLEPYSLLALIQTNESLKTSVEQYYQPEFNKLQDFRKLTTTYKSLSFSDKNKNDIDMLSVLASKLEFDGKNSIVNQVKQHNQEWKNHQSKIKAAQYVSDLVEDLPNKYISNAVKLVAEEFFSGDNYKESDTNLEKSLSNVAYRSAKLANRPTAISKIIGLFLGAMSDTQYIYSMQSRFSTLAEASREKVGNVINASIAKEFNRELSEPEKRALSKSFFDTGLFHIIHNDSNTDINSVLRDKSYRNSYIKAVTNQLLDEYTGINRKELESFINWQTSGLAEMNIKGLAKSMDKSMPSFISTNGRSIAHLTLLKSINAVPNNVTYDETIVENLTNTLIALKSLNYTNQEDNNHLADLYKSSGSAMKLVQQESITAYLKEYATNNSFMGYQNYKHSKLNPNKDYQIIEPRDKERLENLSNLGYEQRMVLPNGEIVMTTNQSMANQITNGILSFTEQSVLGANTATSMRMNSKALDKEMDKEKVNKLFKELWNAQIKINSNYYTNLKDLANYSITLDHTGSINKIVADIPTENREIFLEEVENYYEHLGNIQARQIEELTVARNNKTSIKILDQAYRLDKNKGNYVLLNGKYKAKGNSNEDKRFEKEFNGLYYGLPLSTREEIERMGGLYINRKEIGNILGYNQASITDIFTGKSGLPQPVQNAVKSTMNALVQAKIINNPVKALKRLERFKMDITSLGKDIVLNRSVVVPLMNLVSNVIHLWTAGVPLNDIPKLITQGYQEVKLYNQYESEMIRLGQDLASKPMNQAERNKAQLRSQQLAKMISKLSITPLMESGIYTNISNKEVESSDFSLLTEYTNKYGLNKIKDNIPNFMHNLFISQDSTTHKFMEESMNYGDFLAKYVLYTHLTTKRGMDEDKAMNIIRDEFINYASNRGREFDWLNKVGATWFLQYKLGIQRIIYRNLRRNTLRTLAVWQGSDMLLKTGLPLTDLIQTVPQQRLWTDYSGYHFELDNMVDSFGSHWIEKLLR